MMTGLGTDEAERSESDSETGRVYQREPVLESRRWVFFGRQITGAYGLSGGRTGSVAQRTRVTEELDLAAIVGDIELLGDLGCATHHGRP